MHCAFEQNLCKALNSRSPLVAQMSSHVVALGRDRRPPEIYTVFWRDLAVLAAAADKVFPEKSAGQAEIGAKLF